MAKAPTNALDKEAHKKLKASHKKKASNETSEASEAAGGTATNGVKASKKDKRVLGDSEVSQPMPPKSSRPSDPSTPPPALLDLVHGFLRDQKYVKAAHGLRTDNQKRLDHNLIAWRGTSEGMPDLIGIFEEWQKRDGGRDKQGEGGMSATKKEDDEADMPVDGPEVEMDGVKPEGTAAKQLKRKASAMSSDSTDSESDSASTSSSDTSDSESDSDSEAQPAKKRKSGVGPGELVVSQKNPTKSRTATGDASSDEESDSDSGSSSSSSDSGTKGNIIPKVQDTNSIGTTNRPNSSGSESDSESDSDSVSSDDTSSSSSSESDASGGILTRLSKAATSPLKGNSGSDTSSTLPYPSDTGTPAKAPYSTSDSSSDSSSSSDSELDDSEKEPASTKKAAAKSKSKSKLKPASSKTTTQAKVESHPTDLLTFTTPATETASHMPETTTLPATASNIAKLKKKAVPFSRIPDDVQVDERFSSNKYVPYEYADRAYQDLSVTKGKGFTKEKNKKKRGSYRGGVIDVGGGKGVKFED